MCSPWDKCNSWYLLPFSKACSIKSLLLKKNNFYWCITHERKNIKSHLKPWVDCIFSTYFQSAPYRQFRMIYNCSVLYGSRRCWISRGWLKTIKPATRLHVSSLIRSRWRFSATTQKFAIAYIWYNPGTAYGLKHREKRERKWSTTMEYS